MTYQPRPCIDCNTLFSKKTRYSRLCDTCKAKRWEIKKEEMRTLRERTKYDHYPQRLLKMFSTIKRAKTKHLNRGIPYSRGTQKVQEINKQ